MAETVEVATNVLDDSLDESKASNDSKEELNEKSKETSLELEEKEESTELTKTDEDATMDETDEDKKERAVRQSMSVQMSWFILFTLTCGSRVLFLRFKSAI